MGHKQLCEGVAGPGCTADALLPLLLALLFRPQAKTALADTTGSVFLQKCITAANEGRFDELIKQLSAHLDLVFSKCSDKGEWQTVGLQQRAVQLCVAVLRETPASRATGNAARVAAGEQRHSGCS